MTGQGTGATEKATRAVIRSLPNVDDVFGFSDHGDSETEQEGPPAKRPSLVESPSVALIASPTAIISPDKQLSPAPDHFFHQPEQTVHVPLQQIPESVPVLLLEDDLVEFTQGNI